MDPHKKLATQGRLLLACMTVATALIAGLAGILATLFLHAVQYIFLEPARSPQPWVYPLWLAGTGFFAGLLWWWIRRKPLHTLNPVIAKESVNFPVWRTILDAALQIFIVGAGASIGREVAPRQFAGVLVHRLGLQTRLSDRDRTLLVAAGAGAALAAVYNTPLAGIAFTLWVTIHRVDSESVLVSSVSSLGAVALARLVVGKQAYYVYPPTELTAQEWVWAGVCIILSAGAGYLFSLLCTWGKKAKVPGPWLPWTVALALGLSGVLIGFHADVAGNGVLILQNGFDGNIGLAEFAVLLLLKPLATVFTLRSGAVGGVLTPALAFGASLGGVVALISHNPQLVPVFMVISAGSVLSVSENSAFFGGVFILELVHAPLHLWFPVICASLGAVCVVRGVKKLAFIRRNDSSSVSSTH